MKAKKNIKIGFIGFGEGAFEMSTGFRLEGLAVNFYDVLQELPEHVNRIKEKSQSIGAKMMPNLNTLALKSNIIISAVTSGTALDVAKSIACFLTKDHYYLDINSISPNTKKSIYEIIRKQGSKFIESAVMETIPGKRHKVPMLICGESSKCFFKLMSPYNMNITIIEGNIGAATTIKMLRSIFMKGLAALLIETFGAAYKSGVLDYIYKSLEETIENKTFMELTNRLIGGTAIHATRREHEMNEVIDTLKSLDSKYIMSEATRDLLNWVASMDLKSYFGGEIPSQYTQVLSVIKEKME